VRHHYLQFHSFKNLQWDENDGTIHTCFGLTPTSYALSNCSGCHTHPINQIQSNIT